MPQSDLQSATHSDTGSETHSAAPSPGLEPRVSRSVEHLPTRPPVERVPPGKARSASFLEMVFPDRTNHYGTLFGGEALALMDKAAFVAASRWARRAVVTASSEKVDFHVPVRAGQLVELRAAVIATGRTSMTVEVELLAEDLLSGDRQLATRGRFVMVALDAHGRATAVPTLERWTETEKEGV